jgi:hypothetical protein
MATRLRNPGNDRVKEATRLCRVAMRDCEVLLKRTEEMLRRSEQDNDRP